MDELLDLIKPFFTWIGNHFEFLAAAAFLFWLIRGYFRWVCRFDTFSVRAIRTVAVVKLLKVAGDHAGAARNLGAELVYSDNLMIFTDEERARWIKLTVDVAWNSGDQLTATCDKAADCVHDCNTPFRHLRHRPCEFLKTLFH